MKKSTRASSIDRFVEDNSEEDMMFPRRYRLCAVHMLRYLVEFEASWMNLVDSNYCLPVLGAAVHPVTWVVASTPRQCFYLEYLQMQQQLGFCTQHMAHWPIQRRCWQYCHSPPYLQYLRHRHGGGVLPSRLESTGQSHFFPSLKMLKRGCFHHDVAAASFLDFSVVSARIFVVV